VSSVATPRRKEERGEREMKDDSFLEDQDRCPLSDEEIELRRWELQNALVELSQRGLKKGAKWSVSHLQLVPLPHNIPNNIPSR
jgi:hypothetical protein